MRVEERTQVINSLERDFFDIKRAVSFMTGGWLSYTYNENLVITTRWVNRKCQIERNCARLQPSLSAGHRSYHSTSFL